MTAYTPAQLIAFEDDIAAEFNAGNIKAPVHLAGGNEQQLIDIFREVKADDWICCSWRSHYHCLLKGVPPAKLKAEIMAGHSISLCFPEHRIISSAIVGGIAPIAVGLAMGIKRGRGRERVWCFVGDMTERCGVVQESIAYCMGHGLAIRWVVESNGLSVKTDVGEAWTDGSPGRFQLQDYDYTLTREHVGTGKWVSL